MKKTTTWSIQEEMFLENFPLKVAVWPHEGREEDGDGGDVARDAQAAEGGQTEVTETNTLGLLYC